MSPRENVIQITERTTLQIGGCRITIEPAATPTAQPPSSAPLSPGLGRNSSPREWQMAEAELQEKSRAPFEPPSVGATDRLSFMPRPGGRFRAVGGVQIEIAQVAGRDGSLWFVFDRDGRPYALRRIDLAWHALPSNPLPPLPGDTIVHGGTTSIVSEVFGTAELGGWAVRNDSGVAVHVLRGENGRWMSLGSVEIDG